MHQCGDKKMTLTQAKLAMASRATQSLGAFGNSAISLLVPCRRRGEMAAKTPRVALGLITLLRMSIQA